MKFKFVEGVKKSNSHPAIKIALRKWLEQQFDIDSILDIYGGYGLMHEKVWSKYRYRTTEGEAIAWLKKNDIVENCFDIDPYASPYEALEVIADKTSKNKIGIVCTDGILRRGCMMRTEIPDFLCNKCNWPKRNLSLMAAIYHQYPRFLRHAISCICKNWDIEKLAVKYGMGTWKQATVYFAGILKK